MAEQFHSRSELPPRLRRLSGALALGVAVALPAAGCSAEVPRDCGGVYDAPSDEGSRAITAFVPSPEGDVLLSYNARDGKLVHVYLEKGQATKELTDEELAQRHAEFKLSKSTMDVHIDESSIDISCKNA